MNVTKCSECARPKLKKTHGTYHETVHFKPLKRRPWGPLQNLTSSYVEWDCKIGSHFYMSWSCRQYVATRMQ